MLTRGFDANGNTIYTDSVTGQSTSDSSAYDAQQAINPNNLSAAYQQVYGAAPSQDWLNLTQNAYNGSDSTKVLQDLAYSKATSDAANALGISNTMGSDATFASGAAALQKMGATADPKSPLYQGVPTTYTLNGQQYIYGNTNNGRDASSLAWLNASQLPSGVSAQAATPVSPQDWSNAEMFGLGALGLGGAAAFAPALAGASGAQASGLGTIDALGMTPGAYDTAALTSGTSLTNGALGTEAAYEAGLPGAGQGADALVNGVVPGITLTQAMQALAAANALKNLGGSGSSGLNGLGGSGSSGLNGLGGSGSSGLNGLGGSGSSGLNGLSSLLPYLGAAGLGALLSKSGSSQSGTGIGLQGTGSTGSLPQTLNWNYQQPTAPVKGVAHGQQILNPQYMAKGGLPSVKCNTSPSLGNYSDGGMMLKGGGDGMSDSIPATIEGKRPAQLATDEFVVPADVVSHLGNGSSDAGAKVLYAMMDRVRQARTGNPHQGKQINPNKYMPA
jgi:hypothetical protein